MCPMPGNVLVPATWLRWLNSSRYVGTGSEGGVATPGGGRFVCWAWQWQFGCHLNPAFLRKGVDVIVNASSVEDIDAGAIGQRLSNGLARLSSPVLHRLRLREDENAEPVVSAFLGQPVSPRLRLWNLAPEAGLPIPPHPVGLILHMQVPEQSVCSWGSGQGLASAGYHLPEDRRSRGNEAD